MKLASWNVNSLKVRLPHLLRWLDTERPQAAGPQETKLTDEHFPAAALREAGYAAVYVGQKTHRRAGFLVVGLPHEQFSP